MSKKNQRREGIVFSTDPDFQYQETPQEAEETLAPSQQSLTVYIDRKQRAGKAVTIVEGFIGLNDDLKNLSKQLKTFCGVGGSEKDGLIMIQGEFKDKIAAWLKGKGYKAKMK